MKAPARIVLLVVLAHALGACAGARGSLHFDQLRYPVSSSQALYDAHMQPVFGKQLESVGHVFVQRRFWSLLWSAVPLRGPEDISAPLNAQIAQAGGQGATGLGVRVENCGTNFIPFLNWLPIYPGCALVTVRADVVRAVQAPRAPSSPIGLSPKASTIRKGGRKNPTRDKGL